MYIQGTEKVHFIILPILQNDTVKNHTFSVA